MNVVPYAISYANKINSKQAGYTIEKAKKIFGKYYPLVEKYLIQEKVFRQALEIQLNALMIASAQKVLYLTKEKEVEAFITKQIVTSQKLVKEMNEQSKAIENKGNRFFEESAKSALNLLQSIEKNYNIDMNLTRFMYKTPNGDKWIDVKPGTLPSPRFYILRDYLAQGVYYQAPSGNHRRTIIDNITQETALFNCMYSMNTYDSSNVYIRG